MKRQKEKVHNLYDFSDNINEENTRNKDDINNKKRDRDRQKRLKQRKKEKQFNLENETVIGMTNRNNQVRRQNNNMKMTKKQAKTLRKRKKLKRLLKWTTLFLLIIGSVVFALVSPIFNIKEIEVINNNQLSSDTIISLSQLNENQNIFKISSKKVKNDIKTNSYIQNVKVQKILPDKVKITVEERQKNYNVAFLNGYAYINNQGYILEISEQKLDLPVIEGVSTGQDEIVAGNRLNEQDLSRLEVVIQIMNICKSYQLEDKVSAIYINDEDGYSLYMESEKKTIKLGDASNLSNKMLYVPTILSENEGKEGTIYLNGDINNSFKPRFREKV